MFFLPAYLMMFMNSRDELHDIRTTILDPLIDLFESINQNNKRGKVSKEATKYDGGSKPY
jgi:hypothetical protein